MPVLSGVSEAGADQVSRKGLGFGPEDLRKIRAFSDNGTHWGVKTREGGAGEEQMRAHPRPN